MNFVHDFYGKFTRSLPFTISRTGLMHVHHLPYTMYKAKAGMSTVAAEAVYKASSTACLLKLLMIILIRSTATGRITSQAGATMLKNA
jgi:hypothetical protein